MLCFSILKNRNVKESQPVTVQITSVKPRTCASGADLCTQLCSQHDRNSGKNGCLIHTKAKVNSNQLLVAEEGKGLFNHVEDMCEPH